MKLIWLHVRQARECVILVSESICLRRQLTFLVLELQVWRYLPVVVTSIRYRDELVATSLIFEVWVPSGSYDWNWDHRLTEYILMSIDEVPDRDGRYDLFFTLSGTRHHEQHV